LEAAAAESAAAAVAASSRTGLAMLHGAAFEKNDKGDRALLKIGNNGECQRHSVFSNLSMLKYKFSTFGIEFFSQ
jgi:hypothetical protein